MTMTIQGFFASSPLFALGVALLCGCGGADPEESSPPPAQEQTVEHYFGGGEVRGPSGEDYGVSTSLVRRTTDPAAQIIVEQVINASAAAPPTEYVVTMTVTGATFTMEEEGGAFTGEGDLIGEPWRWNAWRSHAILAHDGGAVDSDDEKTSDGVEAEKKWYAADGKLGVVISESLSPISEGEFEQRRADLLKE